MISLAAPIKLISEKVGLTGLFVKAVSGKKIEAQVAALTLDTPILKRIWNAFQSWKIE